MDDNDNHPSSPVNNPTDVIPSHNNEKHLPANMSPSEPPTESHSTLHYSLLGPSLLKAGQEGVDQAKVSEIIYNASRGSKFFKHEEKRDEQVHGFIFRRCMDAEFESCVAHAAYRGAAETEERTGVGRTGGGD